MHDQHYKGLIAEWYDDWLRERRDDIDYYTSAFAGFRGQVLELACGTGRLLLPIAGSGVAIHGLDSSEDMLEILHRKAAELSIKGVETYDQLMEHFSIPTEYDAIFIASGSFQLLTSTESSLNCLKCVRSHLSSGGFFHTDVFVPWDDIMKGESGRYHVTRDVLRPDGKRSIVFERFEIDIPKQIKSGTYRYEFYDQKRLTDCLTDDLSIRWYWRDEFLSLLGEAGFSRVEVLTQSALYSEGHSFVFRAFK